MDASNGPPKCASSARSSGARSRKLKAGDRESGSWAPARFVDGVLMAPVSAAGTYCSKGVPGLGQDSAGPHAGRRLCRCPSHASSSPPDLIACRRHRHEHLSWRNPATGPGGSSSFRGGPDLRADRPRPTRINRATPKTQSALLEAMQERSVTVCGTDAQTQRTVPGAGDAEPHRAGRARTPLPEAQLDRFIFKIVVGYSQMG